jgi:hypothetical protein
MSKRIWNKPDVPHMGWEYVRKITLDSPSGECEMCGQKHIRYIDVLKHENYAGEMKVGQDCSDIMMLPGKNGFRWPEKDILIIENELRGQFFVVKEQQTVAHGFSSLKEAQSWVINNLFGIQI